MSNNSVFRTWTKLLFRTTVTALGFIGFGSVPTTAITLTSDFTVNVSNGPLIDNTYSGSFTYDDSVLTGAGFEFVSPTAGGLSLSFNFVDSGLMPKTYTELDDQGYSLYPRVEFQNRNLYGLNYGVSFLPTSNFSFDGGSFGYTLDGSLDYSGTVVYSSVSAVPFEIAPLPGSIILGIWAAWSYLRRRDKHK